MKVFDLDMDYFMDYIVADIAESSNTRLPEELYYVGVTI